MNTDPNQTPFGKAIVTGLFAGIVATLGCFVFEIFYRFRTGYAPSEYINVSSLIFTVNLLLLVAGFIYYYLQKAFRKGDLLFAVLFILLTGFCVWKAEELNRFTDHRLSVEFSHLLSGTILIIGACATIIPVLYNNKKFNEFII